MVNRFAPLVLATGCLALVARLGAQCPDGSPPPCGQAGSQTPAPNSVAVLYFDNLSRDTADVYLADGLTDEIIARLGQLDRLRVKSRTAVARFRATALDPRAVGRALGVAFLVNGTVQRGSTRLRVSVELLRAATGDHVWGQQYNRTDEDLLTIEEDIGSAVATAIAGRLATPERASLAMRPTRNPAAYDQFLRGNYQLAQRRPDATLRAIEHYRTAVALDPGFAAALSRIGLGYALILDWGWKAPAITPDTLLQRGFTAVDRALRLDSTSSDGWLARAFLLKHRNPYTYAGTRAAFERAMALDPRSAEAVHQYGSMLTEVGDDSGALAAFRQALALDPERPITLYQIAQVLMIGRQYVQELHWMDSALVIDPNFLIVRARRAITRARLGDRTGALADIAAARELQNGTPLYPDRDEAVAFGLLGDSVEARAAADRVVREIRDSDLSVIEGAFAASALIAAGETTRSLDFLERVHSRGLFFWWFLRWPDFDPVREEPRFQRLVEESRPPGR